jgi:PAS domain S-box-containing protein
VSLVSLVDESRQFFKSHVGLAEPWASRRETPLLHSFCRHVAASGEPLVIEDARENPLVRDNPAIPDLGVVAYAGVPLITSGGHVLGSFCVIDAQPRRWTEEEVGVLRDLAESVMAEIELRLAAAESGRNARETAALLDATGEGIYGIGPDGRCTFVNAATSALLGWRPEEMLGRDIHALAHHSRPDGTPYPKGECPIYQVLVTGREARVEDDVLWRKDGTALPARYSASPVLEGGEVRGAVATVTDITERKRLEGELRALLERESRIARTFQEALLPVLPAGGGFAGLAVAHRYQAAWSEARVGGDFFDALALPDGRVALFVGDVAGKGLAAAVQTSEIRHSLRALLHACPGPVEAVSRLNDLLTRSASAGRPDAGGWNVATTFSALVLAVIDPRSGDAAVVAAGGEPPLVLRAGGEMEEVVGGGLFLGLEEGHAYDAALVSLSPGDAILLVTDGITEARAPGAGEGRGGGPELLGYEGLRRIVEAAVRRAGLPDGAVLDGAAQEILDGALAFGGGTLRDDACLLVARYEGPPGHGGDGRAVSATVS